MTAAVIVALGSATVALISALMSRRNLRLQYELELKKAAATKQELEDELMRRYREPLVRASFELQSRIFNIVEQEFLVRYGKGGREADQEYAAMSTLYVFAEYFAWVEVLRREVQFLDLGDIERNRLLVARLEAITNSFATDKITGREFRIFRFAQRAIGEVMVEVEAAPDERAAIRCMGYTRFVVKLGADKEFARWFRDLAEDVEQCKESLAAAIERLVMLQHALVELIVFLDDPPRRFVDDQYSKLDIASHRSQTDSLPRARSEPLGNADPTGS